MTKEQSITQKPCLVCEKQCSIYAVQLGDSFTLTYLRLCSGECLFELAYEYLHSLYEHKTFMNSLFSKENEEDRKAREKSEQIRLEAFLKAQKESLEKNPSLLTAPIPDFFKDINRMPIFHLGKPIKFIKSSPEIRLEREINYIKNLNNKLEEAVKDLKKILNELFGNEKSS